jgi:hypothetical protein
MRTCPKHGIKLRTFCPACVGEGRSKKKAEAARANGRKGGAPLSNRKCRVCHIKRLSKRNESGVCRDCTRTPGWHKH